MSNADEKKLIEDLWHSNFLNIRRATQTNIQNKTQRIIVGLELYDVCLDYQNNLYPWAREALQHISNCECFRLYVWTNQKDSVSTAVVENIFKPNNINVRGINSGFFVTNPDYSRAKPWIDVLIDRCSGFGSSDWYWIHNLFRVSETIMCQKDDSFAHKIVRGNEKFAVQPTTVRVMKKI